MIEEKTGIPVLGTVPISISILRMRIAWLKESAAEKR
jgi:hypothetical protein